MNEIIYGMSHIEPDKMFYFIRLFYFAASMQRFWDFVSGLCKYDEITKISFLFDRGFAIH